MSSSSTGAVVSRPSGSVGQRPPRWKEALDRQVLTALAPVCGGLAVVFTVLSLFNFVDELARPAAVPIVTTNAATAVFYLALWLALSRRLVAVRRANAVGLTVVGAALVNVLVAFGFTGEPSYLAYLVLLIVGAGAVLLSLSWLLAAVGLTLAGSASVAWFVIPRGELLHYGLLVFAAGALAAVLFVTRRRAVLRAEAALDAAWQEIVRRKEAEEALRAGEERLELAIEGSSGGWWDVAIDPEEPEALPDACYLSPALKGFIGFEDHEFPNSLAAWRARIHPEDLKHVEELERAHLGGGTLVGECRYRIRHRDGGYRWIDARGRVHRTADGTPVRWSGINWDVTERKKIESRLVQSQKLETVGQLVSGVAHDFNNLLTAVVGFAELALAKAGGQESLRGDLLEIKKAGESAGLLTSQLLAFSRQQVLRPRVVCLNDVVRGLEGLLRRTISEDIDLAMRLDPDLGTVRVDPTQMEQILINLATNARDAIGVGGGRLTIETSNRELGPRHIGGRGNGREGAFVQLAVSDTGCGMDAETRERIFEPFFTTKPSGDGTGLGLSTVFGTVKQSGGFIWVYSEPEIGSTFKIYLPRLDETAETVRRTPVVHDSKGSETILLVEDHDGVRNATTSALERHGYRVVAIKDPVEALEIPSRTKVDLLVSDVVMPGLNGVALAQQIRERHPGLKLLFMSGYSRAVARESLAMDPASRYLSKPFRLDELLSAVRESLESQP